jgi:cbb3-type cytochrome oxidase subunit 3
MTFEWLHELRSLWTAWFFLVFAAIVVWTMWPARRGQLEAQARIPLADRPSREAGTNE